jgi:hypothetical protein
MELEDQQDRVPFGQRWRAARPGCGCGRPGCPGCALTPRTVFVLHAELAWIVDTADEDIRAVRAGARPIGQSALGHLPAPVFAWAASNPMWLERFQLAVRHYAARLGRGGPLQAATLAEEVALRMAFAAAGAEVDPDGLLPPDAAEAIPALPGDYAWNRAEAAAGRSAEVGRLYDGAVDRLPDPGDPLHPARWFDRD